MNQYDSSSSLGQSLGAGLHQAASAQMVAPAATVMLEQLGSRAQKLDHMLRDAADRVNGSAAQLVGESKSEMSARSDIHSLIRVLTDHVSRCENHAERLLNNL